MFFLGPEIALQKVWKTRTFRVICSLKWNNKKTKIGWNSKKDLGLNGAMRCSIQKPKRKNVDSGETVGRPQPWRLPCVKRTLFSIRFVPQPRSINSPRLTSNHRIYILTAHGDEGWFAVNPRPPKAPHHHVVNYPLTPQRSRRYRRVHVGLLISHHRCLFTTNFCAPEKVVGEESPPPPSSRPTQQRWFVASRWVMYSTPVMWSVNSPRRNAAALVKRSLNALSLHCGPVVAG